MTKPILIEISDHDKRVLSSVGKGAYGKELMEIFTKVKRQLCSLEHLESGSDHNADVEGRLLFKQFADELIGYMSLEKRASRQRERPELGVSDYA